MVSAKELTGTCIARQCTRVVEGSGNDSTYIAFDTSYLVGCYLLCERTKSKADDSDDGSKRTEQSERSVCQPLGNEFETEALTLLWLLPIV